MSNSITNKTGQENSEKSIGQNRLFWGILAVVLSSGYVLLHLQTGWFPHDEGQLGQAAERVLAGELPHRDFDEMYTGALTYLNAAAFQLMGVRSESTRWMLWFFFVPFSATLFWISCRAAPPWAAALVTFFCASISLPVYSAAIPSWYNLFMTVFGIACLLQFIDSHKLRWIIAAGCFAGLSILFKITGLYWLAAGMLFLVYFEQQQPANPNDSSNRRCWTYDLFVVACLGLFALLSFSFCKSHDQLMAGIHLTLPLVLLAGFLGWQQFQSNRGGFGYRFHSLLKLQLPLLISAMIPLALFAGFYGSQGSLDALYRGLVVLPRQRMEGAFSPFPGWIWLASSLPLAGLLLAGLFLSDRVTRQTARWVGGLFLAASICLLLFWNRPEGFQLTFQSFRNLGPLVVMAALGWLILASRRSDRPMDRQRLFLLCAASATGSLLQFPFASDFYFLYSAPVLVLCVLFLSRLQAQPWRTLHAGLLIFLTFFAVVHMASPVPNSNICGVRFSRENEPVGLQRCTYVVSGSSARVYRELVLEIQNRTQPGEYIFAGPDFPEAYFLADRRNPTRVFYDFFHPELQQQPDRLLDQLDDHGVRLVVLKKFQAFSKLDPSFEASIAKRFPHQKRINRYESNPDRPPELAFVIYWRESVASSENSTE